MQFSKLPVYVPTTSVNSKVIRKVWNSDEAIGRWKYTWKDKFVPHAFLDDIRIRNNFKITIKTKLKSEFQIYLWNSKIYLKHHCKKKWYCFVNIKIDKAICPPACTDLKEGESPKKLRSKITGNRPRTSPIPGKQNYSSELGPEKNFFIIACNYSYKKNWLAVAAFDKE